MRDMRVVLVTRRFWPQVGGAEMVMANLASALRNRVARVTIVTAQWEPHWPREVVHREVPVVRLPNPAQRGWGTFRYMRSLSRWLRKRQSEIDVVCVSMLKHDAYTAIGALANTATPVVLRAEGAGETGDCYWHEKGRFGRRIKRRCQDADAFIAPSEAILGELDDAGFAKPRLHFVANGVAIPHRRHPKNRLACRSALAEVNYDLMTKKDSPVVLYTGRLHPAKGLFELIHAWAEIVKQKPDARLWLVGEGPARDELYETVMDLGLRGRVLMPGAFDEVDDLLQAADVFVLPSHVEGMSLSLLEAMAAETPVVATDIPGNRQLISHEEHGLLVPVNSAGALAAAITAQLERKILAEAYAKAARQRVADCFSVERMAEAHLNIFQSAIENKQRGRT